MPSPSSSVPPSPCPFIPAVSAGFCFAGGVRVGDNNLAGNNPGAVVGHDLATDCNGAQICWDNDIRQGFDSGWVSVQLVGEVGGGNNGVTWSLIQPDGTETTVNYSGVTYATIEQVQVSATVSANNMKVSWQSVAAAFYSNGVLVDAESLDDPCNPVADTTGSNAPNSANEVARLFPNAPDVTKVVVTGLVRMQSPLNVLPAPDAMTGSLFVFADNCSKN